MKQICIFIMTNTEATTELNRSSYIYTGNETTIKNK